MGLPVAGELFGAGGLMFASIYLIPQRVVMWTAGLSCFAPEEANWKGIVKNFAFHPGMVSVYIGLVLMLAHLRLPMFIEQTMSSIGACTTPLSMMLIGSIVGEMDRSQVKIDLFSLVYSAVRLVLIPLACLLGCRLFSVDPLITGVSVVLAGMPVGSTTAILASKYGFKRVGFPHAGHTERKGFLAAQQMAVVRVDSEAGDVQFRTVRVEELSGMV